MEKDLSENALVPNQSSLLPETDRKLVAEPGADETTLVDGVGNDLGPNQSSALTQASQNLAAEQGVDETILEDGVRNNGSMSTHPEAEIETRVEVTRRQLGLAVHQATSWLWSARCLVVETVITYNYWIFRALLLVFVCLIGANWYFGLCDDCTISRTDVLGQTTNQLVSAMTNMPEYCIMDVYDTADLSSELEEMRKLNSSLISFRSALIETRQALQVSEAPNGDKGGGINSLYGAAYNLSSRHRPFMRDLQHHSNEVGKQLRHRPRPRHLIFDHIMRQTHSFLFGILHLLWTETADHPRVKIECLRSWDVWMKSAEVFKAACSEEMVRQDMAIRLLGPIVDGKVGYEAMSGGECDMQCQNNLRQTVSRVLEVFAA